MERYNLSGKKSVRALGAGLTCLLILLAFGCGPELGAELGTLSQASILGDDNRTPLTEKQLGAMVGTLRSPEGKALCTGFFSGLKEMTTAHHCLGAKWEGEGYRFVTADEQDYWVLGIKQQNKGSDLVVLNVDRAVFGAAQQEKQPFLVTGPVVAERSAIIISFDPARDEFLVNEGKAPSLMANHPGLLAHELDTIKGSSGSPIIQGDKVVGMHVGFVTEKMTDTQRQQLTQEPKCNQATSSQQCKVAEPKVIANIGVELSNQHRAVLGSLENELHLECYGLYGYAAYYAPRYSYAYYAPSYYTGYGYSRYWGGYGGYGYGYSSGYPYGAYYGRYYADAYRSYYGYPYSRYYSYW